MNVPKNIRIPKKNRQLKAKSIRTQKSKRKQKWLKNPRMQQNYSRGNYQK